MMRVSGLENPITSAPWQPRDMSLTEITGGQHAAFTVGGQALFMQGQSACVHLWHAGEYIRSPKLHNNRSRDIFWTQSGLTKQVRSQVCSTEVLILAVFWEVKLYFHITGLPGVNNISLKYLDRTLLVYNRDMIWSHIKTVNHRQSKHASERALWWIIIRRSGIKSGFVQVKHKNLTQTATGEMW